MAEAERLLEWYDGVRRQLPWRCTEDPYHIWLSEVMLQQTRVETVIPYYERFLARFPSVAALAAAAEEEVLALWSGLGYYRRARQLHRAAGEIVARGGFPNTARGLAELPGIGPYTAAAVASIAFGEAVPVLDGNVERVVTRLLGWEGDSRSRAGRERLVETARARLLSPRRPGDSNQAMMELGATVCIPRRPRCPGCPLAPGCRARALGDPERYPPPRPRRAVEGVHRALAVVEEEDGAVLLFRRADGEELLAGTWELPWVDAGQPAALTREELASGLARRYGGRWSIRERLGQVRHGITFRDLRVEVWRARLSWERVGEAPVGVAGVRFFLTEEISAVAVSSLVRKALGLLGEGAPVSRGRSRRRPG